MKILGVTGGIGSGKSYVCAILETYGIPIYYADSRAKDLLVQNAELQSQVKELMGHDAYTEAGELNRAYIASLLFNEDNKELYKEYNSLVHKAVLDDFGLFCRESEKAGRELVGIETAILIESGFDKSVDYIVAVEADIDIRIERVKRRDNSTEEQIRERINFQMSDKQRGEYADFVIKNSGDCDCESQIKEIIKKILCQ